MFLFSRKTKTPISTYTDSYRPPNTVKKTFEEHPMALWSENKFVTQGLTVPRLDNQVDQAHLEKMVKNAVQEYTYKNSIEPTAYRPYKYWVTREEERYNPIFVGDDRYATWRTGPYNSATWNRYTTYLPRIPRDAGMQTILHGMPMQYPPKPERLNSYASLANPPSPLIPSRQGCPTKGNFTSSLHRHYCLREWTTMDGAPSNEQQISHLVEKIVGVWRLRCAGMKPGSCPRPEGLTRPNRAVERGSSRALPTHHGSWSAPVACRVGKDVGPAARSRSHSARGEESRCFSKASGSYPPGWGPPTPAVHPWLGLHGGVHLQWNLPSPELEVWSRMVLSCPDLHVGDWGHEQPPVQPPPSVVSIPIPIKGEGILPLSLLTLLFLSPASWPTSHFRKSGGAERDSYIIHPEFASESYPAPSCWW
ncbi:spermatid-specific manchette-related protein 1 [Sphaerodactylus townsendi]|uniref:spermatid-specific manchette-related protein 1 n=1 Tax=Sphaerodactylus townsendi TaxID=933632 RepID=UPI002026E1C5|nr:spermatid-specific manchette-related protein 1 [Sphaerodactylus townsendi]